MTVSKPETVEVTQADRLAYCEYEDLDGKYRERVLAGEWDHVAGVRAFARHRLLGQCQVPPGFLCIHEFAVDAARLNATPSRQEALQANEIDPADDLAIANRLSAVLPAHIEWSHIREASRAFTRRLGACVSCVADPNGEKQRAEITEWLARRWDGTVSNQAISARLRNGKPQDCPPIAMTTVIALIGQALAALSDTPPPDNEETKALREALKDAYTQGALDVHNYWLKNPGEAPRGDDPEFGEAASDYATGALSAFNNGGK